MKTKEERINELVFPDEMIIDTLGEDIQFVSKNDALNLINEIEQQTRDEMLKFFTWCNTDCPFLIGLNASGRVIATDWETNTTYSFEKLFDYFKNNKP